MSTNKRNLNKEIIGLFSGQSTTITTPKLYIELTKSYSQANVLNQCVYWENKSELKNGWFYKSYAEWFEEIHIPERTLRRILKKLENKGFIITKTKKVKGLNTLHIHANIDFIIEQISNMLNQDRPNRPPCPDGSEFDQNSCTKSAPTGHNGRSEPATLAVSTIYTDDNLQIKTTNCSSSFVFSETTDKNLLNQKLPNDPRTPEEFLEDCLVHVEHHSNQEFSFLQRANALVKLLKKLKIDGILFKVNKKGSSKNKPETPAQRAARYEAERRKTFPNEYNEDGSRKAGY